MSRLSSKLILRLTVVVAFLAAWQTYSSFVPPILLASPASVATSLIEMLSTGYAWRTFEFYPNLGMTLFEIFVAYAVSIVLGLSLGFALGLFRRFGAAYEPLILAFFIFPHAVIYPVGFLIFGIGELPKIVIGVIVGVSYIIFNTTAAIRQVDERLISLAKSMGYSRLVTFYKVMIPSAAPTIIAGLRLGFAYTLIGVIVGELILPNSGLGLLLNVTAQAFQTPRYFALIVVSVGLGVAGDTVFRIAESSALRWKQ